MKIKQLYYFYFLKKKYFDARIQEHSQLVKIAKILFWLVL
jgi:hypothetical protein